MLFCPNCGKPELKKIKINTSHIVVVFQCTTSLMIPEGTEEFQQLYMNLQHQQGDDQMLNIPFMDLDSPATFIIFEPDVLEDVLSALQWLFRDEDLFD